MHKNTETSHNLSEDEARSELARREWTDPARVAQWASEWRQHVRQSAAATSAMVGALSPRPGQRILDLATGTGDPALTLARAVSPGGRVTCADLSSGMLESARAHAHDEGLDNLDFVVAGGESLPFLAETFDAVSCRFGIMFMLDALAALREMRRVLVPGGRVALMVWGREDQPFFDDRRGTLLRHWKVIPPVRRPLAPWRFQEPDSLSSLLVEAGFGSVQAQLLELRLPSGPPEPLLEAFRKQWRDEFAKMPASIAERILAEVEARLASHTVGGEVFYTGEVWLVTGSRE